MLLLSHTKVKVFSFGKDSDFIMKLRIIGHFILIVFVSLEAFGQSKNQIPVGTWRDFLPFNASIGITQTEDLVVCASPFGLVLLRRSDQSVEVLSRANGLSDIGISAVNYHEGTRQIMVSYRNGNIDLIRNGVITNFSDIKRTTSIQGNKSINAIYMHENYAYLACSFGIVQFDMEKREVRSTFFPTPEPVRVNDVVIDNGVLYAATAVGVLKAELTNPSIVFFAAWSPLALLSTGNYTHIAAYEGSIYAAKAKSQALFQDTVYLVNSTQASVYYINDQVKDLFVNASHVLSTGVVGIQIENKSTGNLDFIYTYNFEKSCFPSSAIPDRTEAGVIWVADAIEGLVRTTNIWGISMYPIEGPPNTKAFNLASNAERIYVSAGAFDLAYSPRYITDGYYTYDGINWTKTDIPANNDFLRDIVEVYPDPNEANTLWVSSYGNGLGKMVNNTLTEHYLPGNSSLLGLPSFANDVRVTSVAKDKNGLLWVSNSGASSPVSVKAEDGSWKRHAFNSFVNSSFTGRILVDSSDQKWVIVKNRGLLLFKNEGVEIEQFRTLNETSGNGSLSSNSVLSIAQDRDGYIWVGTSKGVCVFYSPESVLEANFQGWEAQRIIVSQGGFNQYLLESEEVTSIYVDGANRKWFGTSKAGLFLVSPDGTEQIENFTTENSPLLSNNILSLTMNEESGELFIATEEGISTFRSDATKGEEVFGKVYAFPNPVRPNYTGDISIVGLVTDADVKITDVSGNLVFNTKANGGMARWNGRRFDGGRVATGVYLVFLSNSDGSQTKVTKILVVN